MGGTPTMAVSISMLMIVISMAAVMLQRHLIGKRRYAGAMTQRTALKPEASQSSSATCAITMAAKA